MYKRQEYARAKAVVEAKEEAIPARRPRRTTEGLGAFTFVLHTHLPYARMAGRWPHGEEWIDVYKRQGGPERCISHNKA